MKGFNGYLKEATPPNAHNERGKIVDQRGYVDSNHTGEKKTRRSCSGFLIFLNNALIQLFSKNQSTIKTSVFGEEFVDTMIFMKTLRGIR